MTSRDSPSSPARYLELGDELVVRARSGDVGAFQAEIAEAGALRAQLETLLAALPSSYRVAVVLRDVEGLSNEEASRLLGIDTRNFKSRLHRGRMALRRRLEELAGSDWIPSPGRRVRLESVTRT